MKIRELCTELDTLLTVFLFFCFLTMVLSIPDSRFIKPVVLFCWVVFAVMLVSYLVRYRRLGIAIAAGAVLVAFGFVLPKPITIMLLDYPNEILDNFGFEISAGKVLHIVVYAFLGAVYVYLVRSKSRDQLYGWFILTLALVAAMGMSEVFQLYTPNRTSTFKDIAYNAIGVGIGVVLAVMQILVLRYRAFIN